jgi:nucleoside-diphosphate kinase
MERTLVLLKPDALQRALVGVIISRLETRGLKLAALKMVHMDKTMATHHYSVHADKGFFPGLVTFITSGPIVAIVIDGKDSVQLVRNLMGETDPSKALPGTIRGDLAKDIGRNLIHGSDSPEQAAIEIALFFSPEEILNYPRDTERWITES